MNNPQTQGDLGTDKTQAEQTIARKVYAPGIFDIWALGITIVIGGQYFAWNEGLSAGFGTFSIATMTIASAYICLVCTIAEITSTVPFAGGVYSLTRCVIGMYPGFLAGSSEVLELIVYTATSALALSNICREIFHLNEPYWDLIISFGFYLSACVIYITGGRIFWNINTILAVISLGIILVYGFGSFQYINFMQYASYQEDGLGHSNSYRIAAWFRDPASSFFRALPLSTWFYIGIESLVFTSDIVENPTKTIPRAMILCMMTLFVTSLLVLVCCCSTLPGTTILQTESSPLSFGLSRILHMPRLTTHILSLPAMFATGFGFIYGYGKVLASMSKSNLFPKYFLSYETESGKVPYGGILVGSYIGFMICVVVYFIESLESYLFDICVIFSCVNYITQCCGYYVIKTQFSHLRRDYYSPFGLYGALYAGLVFLAAIAGVIGFTPHSTESLISVGVVLTLLSIYYWTYAQRKQEFNNEELTLTFKAFIVKHNKRSAQRLKNRRGTKISPLLSISSPQGGKRQGSSIFSPRILNFGEKRVGVTPVQDRRSSNHPVRSIAQSALERSHSRSVVMPKIDEMEDINGRHNMRMPEESRL